MKTSLQVDNPSELLYLVSEDDETIGSVIRAAANSNPCYIHREIGVILFNKDSQLLFQQRSKQKKISPGVWSISCAGHVEYGKTVEETAHLELQEELGFDLPLLFIDKKMHRLANETHIMSYFFGYYDGQEIKYSKDEVADVRFLNQEQFTEQFANNPDFIQRHGDICQGIWQGKYTEIPDFLVKNQKKK